MNKIKKIKKFKKSKKTNNKRNHKRRHMTRKLRGGVKTVPGGEIPKEVIPGEVIKADWPLGAPEPPPPTITPYDESRRIHSIIEPPQETQRLEERINEIQQETSSQHSTKKKKPVTRAARPPVRVEQRDDQVVTREDYDILRDKIDVLTENVGGLLKIKDNETMVPLLFKIGTYEAVFINKNITAFNAQNVPVRNANDGNPDYISYFLDLYQLLKFKRLQKIDFNIIQSFTILLPGLDENGMPNIIWVPRTASNEEARPRNRKLYKFFEENFNSKIKYIYRSSTRPRDSPPIEYDLEGLKDILIQELSLSPEREPDRESSSGEEVEVDVKPWYHKGKKYLKSSVNRVYDAKTQERIGIWNEEEDTIEEISESSDDSE